MPGMVNKVGSGQGIGREVTFPWPVGWIDETGCDQKCPQWPVLGCECCGQYEGVRLPFPRLLCGKSNEPSKKEAQSGF